MADIDEQFEDWRWRADRLQALADNRVLVLGSTRLRGRGSGIEFDQPMAWLIEIRNGRLLALDVFTDPQQGLVAAGLAEQP